jgi:hypothetical protein
MPVVPRFRLRQDDEFLYVEIVVPYVRVSDLDFVLDGCDFSFYCHPYLLRLTLPGGVVEDERAKAVFDPDSVRVCHRCACLACFDSSCRTMGRSRFMHQKPFLARSSQGWISSPTSSLSLPHELPVSPHRFLPRRLRVTVRC